VSSVASPERFFSELPILTTARLQLRPLELADARALFEVFSDGEAMRFWSTPAHVHVNETRDMIERSLQSYTAEQGLEWALTLRGDDRAVGKVGHWRWARQHFRAEIGYILRRDLWGRGLGREALAALCDFGFSSMQLHSIEAQIDPANDASRHLLEKFGFVQEGHLRENYFAAGKFNDTLIYSLLRR
jgi:ribosomal-protein-alanine N-acetyltransferase